MQERVIDSKHNNPPKDDFEILVEKIDLLYLEGKNWLDGTDISNEAEANAVGELIRLSRELDATAKDMHKVEKEPFLVGGRAVDDKYRPIREKAEKVATGCKIIASKWLKKIDDELKAKALAAQKEAEAKALEAQKAFNESKANDLEAREKAEELLAEAKKAESAANYANKQTAQLKGSGRAVGLKTKWKPVLVDPLEALKYYKEHKPERLKAFLLGLAEEDVRLGKRLINGFDVIEEKVVS